jgi:hypothetical protein
MKSIISLVLAGVLASSVVCTESLSGKNSAEDAENHAALKAYSPPAEKPCLCG